jgi:hypothetical protein
VDLADPDRDVLVVRPLGERIAVVRGQQQVDERAVRQADRARLYRVIELLRASEVPLLARYTFSTSSLLCPFFARHGVSVAESGALTLSVRFFAVR